MIRAWPISRRIWIWCTRSQLECVLAHELMDLRMARLSNLVFTKYARMFARTRTRRFERDSSFAGSESSIFVLSTIMENKCIYTRIHCVPWSRVLTEYVRMCSFTRTHGFEHDLPLTGFKSSILVLWDFFFLSLYLDLSLRRYPTTRQMKKKKSTTRALYLSK